MAPCVLHLAALGLLGFTAGATTSFDSDVVSLLQVSAVMPQVSQDARVLLAGASDLAMAYLPYNFGHTVAKAALRGGVQWGDCGSRDGSGGACLGHMKSSVTGCELMYTPGKYWPTEAAAGYFGNRTVFGILRDPYERLVATIRGSGRVKYATEWARCDLNTAVKQKMQEYIAEIAAGNPYGENCQQLPQAEFFDPPFGITVPVDNRRFPESANELLTQHGYPTAMQVQHGEIDHVSGCDHVWAADLDEETRAMVKQVYKRDFELLCQHFGYCDDSESTCITHVQGMCPPQLFTWDNAANQYMRK